MLGTTSAVLRSNNTNPSFPRLVQRQLDLFYPRHPLPLPKTSNYIRDTRRPYSASIFSVFKPKSKPRQRQYAYGEEDEHGFPLRPPPISARLKPLIPFFIYWCAITSLAVHLLRMRVGAKEESDKSQAQISVLEGLIERFKKGERVGGDEIQRELEMVGLRERLLTKPEEGEGGDVGWVKALFGRRGVKEDQSAEEKERMEDEAVEEWARVVNEATSTSHPAPSVPAPPARTGTARRAPSSTVYL